MVKAVIFHLGPRCKNIIRLISQGVSARRQYSLKCSGPAVCGAVTVGHNALPVADWLHRGK